MLAVRLGGEGDGVAEVGGEGGGVDGTNVVGCDAAAPGRSDGDGQRSRIEVGADGGVGGEGEDAGLARVRFAAAGAVSGVVRVVGLGGGDESDRLVDVVGTGTGWIDGHGAMDARGDGHGALAQGGADVGVGREDEMAGLSGLGVDAGAGPGGVEVAGLGCRREGDDGPGSVVVFFARQRMCGYLAVDYVLGDLDFENLGRPGAAAKMGLIVASVVTSRMQGSSGSW